MAGTNERNLSHKLSLTYVDKFHIFVKVFQVIQQLI